MTRRTAVAVSIPAALVALALVAATSRATVARSSAVPRLAAPAMAAAGAPAAPAAEPATACPRPGGAAASAAATRVDPADLAAVSALAFALERAAERASAGPALPQTMGLDADGTPAPCLPLP